VLVCRVCTNGLSALLRSAISATPRNLNCPKQSRFHFTSSLHASCHRLTFDSHCPLLHSLSPTLHHDIQGLSNVHLALSISVLADIHTPSASVPYVLQSDPFVNPINRPQDNRGAWFLPLPHMINGPCDGAHNAIYDESVPSNMTT